MFQKLKNKLTGPRIVADMYAHDNVVHEDELILSYLNSFAYTIKLWVDSHQEERIIRSIDEFACILTAYLHGRMHNLSERG